MREAEEVHPWARLRLFASGKIDFVPFAADENVAAREIPFRCVNVSKCRFIEATIESDVTQVSP
jgi:hypothetical protein